MPTRPSESSDKTAQHNFAHFACENEICISDAANTNEGLSSGADRDANALRTAYGSRGDVSVLANYVKIRNLPKSIHHYTIQVLNHKSTNGGASKTSTEKKIARLREKKQIFKAVVKCLNLDQDKSLLWATDYTTIWVTEPLDSKNMEDAKPAGGGDILLNNVDFESTVGQSTLGNHIQISTMPQLDLSGGHLDIGTVSTGNLSASNAISVLNAMMNRRVCESKENDDIFQVGANRFFMPKTAQPIRGGCETMRGYFTSVRPGVSELFMNVNTATAAFYRQITVADFMIEMKNSCSVPYDQVEKYLEGVRVRDVSNINKFDTGVAMIVGLGDSVESQHYWKTGTTASFSVFDDYTEALKNEDHSLQHVELPCVNICVQPHKEFLKAQNPIARHIDGTDTKPGLHKAHWVPPECLEIEPNQLFKEPLLGPQTEDMISKARRLPADNAKLIVTEGLRRIVRPPTSQNDTLSAENKLITVPAQIIVAPGFQMQQYNPKVENGSLNLSRGVFVRQSVLPQAGIKMRAAIVQVSFSGLWIQESQDTQRFANNLAHQIQKLSGLEVELTTGNIAISNQNLANTTTKVVKYLKNLKTPHLVVFILPRADLDVYAAIKKVGDYTGIRTSCCVPWNSMKQKQQERGPDYYANIAMKISLKFRGENHYVQGWVFDKLHDGNDVNTIIIDADVTHPSSLSTPGCPSVAAVVGSVDGRFCTFSASSRLQAGGKELITNLQDMTRERIIAWACHHRRLPKNILYYHDGVSESQYTELRNDEGSALSKGWTFAKRRSEKLVKRDKTFADISLSDSTVNITIIVVGKRHHTRFYPVNRAQSYRGSRASLPWDNHGDRTGYNGNCKPGLVVDRVIANPYVFDFFLQSHHAIVGTARPAHYYVLQNHMKLTPNEIQNITHALCYTYQRATKAISYCAPAYLADKLCDRTRCYIRGWLTGRVDIARPKKDNEGHGAWLKRVADEEMEDERGLWNTAVTGEKATVRAEGPWSSKIDDGKFWL